MEQHLPCVLAGLVHGFCGAAQTAYFLAPRTCAYEGLSRAQLLHVRELTPGVGVELLKAAAKVDCVDAFARTEMDDTVVERFMHDWVQRAMQEPFSARVMDWLEARAVRVKDVKCIPIGSFSVYRVCDARGLAWFKLRDLVPPNFDVATRALSADSVSLFRVAPCENAVERALLYGACSILVHLIRRDASIDGLQILRRLACSSVTLSQFKLVWDAVKPTRFDADLKKVSPDIAEWLCSIGMASRAEVAACMLKAGPCTYIRYCTANSLPMVDLRSGDLDDCHLEELEVVARERPELFVRDVTEQMFFGCEELRFCLEHGSFVTTPLVCHANYDRSLISLCKVSLCALTHAEIEECVRSEAGVQWFVHKVLESNTHIEFCVQCILRAGRYDLLSLLPAAKIDLEAVFAWQGIPRRAVKPLCAYLGTTRVLQSLIDWDPVLAIQVDCDRIDAVELAPRIRALSDEWKLQLLRKWPEDVAPVLLAEPNDYSTSYQLARAVRQRTQ